EKVGKFPVEHDGEIDYIEIKAIKYIAPEEKGSVIHTGKQAYHVKASLKDLETKLLPYNFFRIHRSYLVNLNDVKRLVRSEEHTSELQSRFDLVCRLLLEKKKKKT